jgi:hypothetical protein
MCPNNINILLIRYLVRVFTPLQKETSTVVLVAFFTEMLFEYLVLRVSFVNWGGTEVTLWHITGPVRDFCLGWIYIFAIT